MKKGSITILILFWFQVCNAQNFTFRDSLKITALKDYVECACLTRVLIDSLKIVKGPYLTDGKKRSDISASILWEFLNVNSSSTALKIVADRLNKKMQENSYYGRYGKDQIYIFLFCKEILTIKEAKDLYLELSPYMLD